MNSRWTSVGCLLASLVGWLEVGFSWACLLTCSNIANSHDHSACNGCTNITQTYNVVVCTQYALCLMKSHSKCPNRKRTQTLCTRVCVCALRFEGDRCVCVCAMRLQVSSLLLIHIFSFTPFFSFRFGHFAIRSCTSWYGHTFNKASAIHFDFYFFVLSS